MSNVIKAYNVRYEEKVKEIDNNDRAEELIKEYFAKTGKMPLGADLENDSELLDENQAYEYEEGNESEDGFTSGLNPTMYDGDGEDIIGYNEEKIDESDLSETDEFSSDFVAMAKANSKKEANASKKNEREEKLENEQAFDNEEFIRKQEEIKLRIEEESAKILEDARNEVKRMMSQAIKDSEEEKKRIFEKARAEGFEQGFNEGNLQIEQMKEELAKKDEARKLEYEKQLAQVEPIFVDIVISLVQKLIGIEAEDNKEIIFYLLHQALINQTASNSYIIRVSRNDYDYVMAKKEVLQANIKKDAVVEILEDKLLTKNQCLIETDSRIIDCSLDVQLKNLIKDLKLLSVN